jgi:signal transduction histidine kinase
VGPDGPRVRVVVDDSGPGIPETERARIFDRFHRATDTASSGAGGAGLGLAIADSIVRATGGRWRIGSSPEGGASMSVSWPRTGVGRGEPADVHEGGTRQRPVTS